MTVQEKIEEGAYRAAYPGIAGRQAYRAEQGRLNQRFRDDLLAEHSVAAHPKALRAYEIAWERGHSSGLGEVATYFAELVELLR